MKSKLAQATIFVILAVILIGMVVIFLFIEKGGKDTLDSQTSPDVLQVNSFVDDCIKQTGENGILYIGGTGGYLIPPEESYFYNNSIPITYYLYNNENKMPSKESMENELNSYMDNFLYFCTMDFRDLDGFKVNSSSVKTKTQILNNHVVFYVNFPISFSKSNMRFLPLTISPVSLSNWISFTYLAAP